jgi:hypothetical protein
MLSGPIETKKDDGIWFRRTIVSDAVMQRETSQSRWVRVVSHEDEAHVGKRVPDNLNSVSPRRSGRLQGKLYHKLRKRSA